MYVKFCTYTTLLFPTYALRAVYDAIVSTPIALSLLNNNPALTKKSPLLATLPKGLILVDGLVVVKPELADGST